jgi:hypothetical protein
VNQRGTSRPAAAGRDASPLRTAAAPPPAWPSLAAGGAALALYLAWCPRVPGDQDSPEFMLVLATLGLAHPTGYPLYTLLGHAFVTALHGAGATWGYAANAWSALGGAVAMGLLHAFGARLLSTAGVRARDATLLALLPVLALAANPVWTNEATLAEVNSWHLAWVAGACLFASVQLDRRDSREPNHGAALAWGVLCGLGLAHHRTSVWVAAPLTFVLLARAGRRAPALAPAALVGALAPLTSYAYVAWRASHPAAVQWPALEPGARGLSEFVSGTGYAHYLGTFAPSEGQRELLAHDVYPWLAPAAAAALALPFVRSGTPAGLRAALAAAVAVQVGYVFAYGVPDPASYFLPPLAIGLAVAPALLAALAPARRVGRPLAAAALLLVIAAGRTWPGVAVARAATFTKLDRLMRDMWASIPRERGYVIFEDDQWYRLVAFQVLEGTKRELTVVNPVHFRHAGVRRAFAARHGFDPLAQLPPAQWAAAGTGAELDPLRAAMVDGLARTGEPVFVFLPQVPSVRLLRERGAAPADGVATPVRPTPSAR